VLPLVLDQMVGDASSWYASVSCIRVGSLGRANSESTCVLGERVIPWSTLSKLGALAIFEEAIQELVATREELGVVLAWA